jgi:hypothetical protein
MENFIQKTIIFLARICVVGFFTFVYVTPLYMLLYLIIFQNIELLNEISVKSFAISYLVGFVIIYINVVSSTKKDEKQVE